MFSGANIIFCLWNLLEINYDVDIQLNLILMWSNISAWLVNSGC